MAEDTWQLSLDPNDEKSWRKGGGAQGRGVIVETGYELWGFPSSKPGKQRTIQVFATITVAFENMQKLWATHQMAAWTPSDKDPKNGLAPSKDGKEPIGGWDRVIAIREGREVLPEIHDFKGPLVARRGNAQFVEDEQFYQNLKALSDASIANLATGGYSLHTGKPDSARIAPGNFSLDISWMVGLDCDFMPQDSTRQIRPKSKKTNVLAETSEPDEQKGPVQVLCAVGLYGKKTPEEVAAIKAEYLAREAANSAPATSTGVAPGSIASSSASSAAPASSGAKASSGGKKTDLSPELIQEFEDALVEALSRDSCSFEIDVEGQRVKLDHTGLRDSLMQPIVNQLKGVDKKTKFAYWIQHELPAVASERWEYDASTNLISLKG